MADTQNTEEWRDVAGWTGVYRVSSHGRCMTVKTGKIHNPWIKDGYQIVTFAARNGEPRKKFKVARLVCAAFHGRAPSDTHQVNHINGVRNDDRPCNLEWTTPHENTLHKSVLGTNPTGEAHWRTSHTEDQIQEIRHRYDRRAASRETLRKIAADFNLSPAAVCLIGKRSSWRHLAEANHGVQ